MSAPAGLLVVDKPAGQTSHDVVAAVRRLAGTRRVGHAGTLDPAATGVLVLGIGAATRLLGHLAAADKDYDATIRLGLATTTDDAQGEPVGGSSAAGVSLEQVSAAARALTGTLEQVPSAVSAVKVAGRPAYARVRAGEQVDLAARTVTVSVFRLDHPRRPSADLLDVDATVTCSTGTYVRALARDLGSALGTGGHLTALRRTRVGTVTLAHAHTLAALTAAHAAGAALPVVPLADAVDAAFARLDLSPEQVTAASQGRTLAAGAAPRPAPRGPGPDPAAGAGEADALVGAFAPDGQVVALLAPRDGGWAPRVVFAPAPPPTAAAVAP